MINSERRAEKVRALLESEMKATYLPVLEAGEDDLAGSKLAGTPWMPKGKKWPTCKACKRPMMLLAQLDLGELPEGGGKSGSLVQIFHCGGSYECNEGDVTHSPGGRGVALRVVTASTGGGVHAGAKKAAARHHTPPHSITGWTRHSEYPSGDDIRDLELELHAKEWRVVDKFAPRDGIKLFGWPNWVQTADWPDCPTCDERMELLIQLESERHIPVSFGDGLAYVTRCPAHPKRLAISWSFT